MSIIIQRADIVWYQITDDFSKFRIASNIFAQQGTLSGCPSNLGETNTKAWWRHQMETFSALLVICAGNSPVPGEFPTQRPVTWIFRVFFDLRMNKPLSKQSWGWWFEALSRPLWHHCNGFQHWLHHGGPGTIRKCPRGHEVAKGLCFDTMSESSGVCRTRGHWVPSFGRSPSMRSSIKGYDDDDINPQWI